MRNTLIFLSLFGSLFAGGYATGQDPHPMKDALLDTPFLRTYAQTRGFMLGRPTKARPTPDGKSVLFLRSQPRQPRMAIYEFDVATGKTRELLTPELVLKGAEEKLTPEEKARRERMRVSVGGFTTFQLSRNGAHLLVSLSGRLYLVERATGGVRELRTGSGTLLDPKFAPDGKSVAYVRDHDVYVYDLTTDKEQRITTGGSERVTHGLAEFVAQEEMNRFSGYWWSPDSHSIVYEEADATSVEVWYVADPAHPDRPALTSFYPRPGKANVKVRLGIVSLVNDATTWIEWDVQKYPYLARVHWDRQGPLTVTVQSRDQKDLALLRVEPATGKTTPLVTEHDDTWVNLVKEMPRWLANGKRFLWVGERTGGPQLEIRADDGKLLRCVVAPEAGFRGLVDLDEESETIVYRASVDPTQSQLYRTSLKKGEPVALTREAGVHDAVFARNHSVYVHQTALADAMPQTTVHKADGTKMGALESVAEEPPFKPQLLVEKVGEGEGFYTAMVRPRVFDAKKRYPVIVDVYGGPLHNKVVHSLNTRLLDQWIADQGFIVVSIDGRGTPGRGRDWERAIYKKFGSVPLEDQVAGLKALAKKHPQMDLDRVGIVGWSFGGYLSGLAALRRPDVFKAAVAGAPVVDWLDYDTHYTERYLGVPPADADAYKEASLLTYADELKRPLLLLHGTADDNVYFRHSLKMASSLFRAGKDFEILPLSGLTHMVPDPVVNERLWSRIVHYFQAHLGKPRAMD